MQSSSIKRKTKIFVFLNTFYFHSLSFEFHVGAQLHNLWELESIIWFWMYQILSFFKILLERLKQNVLLQLRFFLSIAHVAWETPLFCRTHICWWAGSFLEAQGPSTYWGLDYFNTTLLHSIVKEAQVCLPITSMISEEKATCLQPIIGPRIQWTREALSIWTIKIPVTCWCSFIVLCT